MKFKKLIYLSIIVLFLLTSCSSFYQKKNMTKIRKIDENNSPIPEFINIEKYIRNSYNNNVNNDEIRRESYINNSQHLDLIIKSIILKGNIIVGLYKEDVLASLGNPKNKIQYYTDFGTKEEWIYENNICFFENGILKNFINSKQ